MNMTRAAMAASNAQAEPTPGARMIARTNSRTPAPPGSNDANPTTMANAIAAVDNAHSRANGGTSCALGIAATSNENAVPINNQDRSDQAQPAMKNRPLLVSLLV